jgi:PIF1-like helicase/Helicase
MLDPQNNEGIKFFQEFDLGKSIFLTGKAGTGKTFIISLLIKKLEQECKNFVVVAPTGIAALQAGGVTIHSLFRLKPAVYMPNDQSLEAVEGADKIVLSKATVIIIDEVSMLRADVMDAMDCVLRKTFQSNLPFAGKQVIMVGDMFQLPPVVQTQTKEHEVLEAFYSDGVFFFNAKVFQKLSPVGVELSKIYRQKDEDFKNILNNIRVGKTNKKDIAKINERFINGNSAPDNTIELTTSNKLAMERNSEELAKLRKEAHTFEATITGVYDESLYPTEKMLILKEGAQVMLLKNSKENNYSNGTIGIIESFTPGRIFIKLADGSTINVTKEEWQKNAYSYNKETNKIEKILLGTFSQFPLKLAYAITIHKSQGLTFDRVCVNMGYYGAFACGQTYVAISRCTSLEGLYLRKKLKLSDIQVDANALAFYHKYFE